MQSWKRCVFRCMYGFTQLEIVYHEKLALLPNKYLHDWDFAKWILQLRDFIFEIKDNGNAMLIKETLMKMCLVINYWSLFFALFLVSLYTLSIKRHYVELLSFFFSSQHFYGKRRKKRYRGKQWNTVASELPYSFTASENCLIWELFTNIIY